ncbi:unnamed protein product [Durusdinium trenchii]|uniref:Ion transport domain-containing protein n=1 Tax=Durusdinium trenchii TaxID=1381693 RepID=A0ABP0PUK6_9DINO
MAYFGYFIVKNGYLSLLQHVHIYIYHLIHTFLTFYLQRSFDSPLIPPFSDGIPPTRPAVSSSTGAVSSAVVPPTGAARAAGGCARLGHVMSRRESMESEVAFTSKAVLQGAQAELTKSVESARAHMDALHDQLLLLESKQKRLLGEIATAHEEALQDVTGTSSAEAKGGGVMNFFNPSSLLSPSPKQDKSRRRSAAITKESDLQQIRDRLREYNESASRILGGRMEMNCDKGVSVKCIVSSPLFDGIAAFLIMFNSFVVGWETEWFVYNTESDPTIEALSSFCNWVFFVELVLRLAAFRMDFFCNRERRNWNIFDFILVVLGIVDELSIASAGTVGSVKMLKMLRILRIFRVFRFFRPLARLALMIMDSIRSLLWAMFMLALITFVFAVSLTSQASTWLMEQVDTGLPDWYSRIENHEDPTVRLVQFYYGSLANTIYTLAQTVLAGVNWHEVMEPLLQVGWFPASLQLLYISFTLLAVLNVITGVFVDNAFRSADKQQTDIIQKEVDKKEECLSLVRGFFNAVDIRQEGLIRLEDLVWFLDDATMDAFFRVLGFDCYDKHRFTELLDLDGTGTVSFEEFLEGCMRYRGVAQGVDMHLVIRDVSRLQKSVGVLQEYVRNWYKGRLLCWKRFQSHPRTE